MNKLLRALRKAVATFIFATGGLLLGANLFGIDAATWKLIASVGLGALVNLAYRWSESVIKEPVWGAVIEVVEAKEAGLAVPGARDAQP